MSDEICEHCETLLNRSGCLVCGAPVCCPKCCKETTQGLKWEESQWKERKNKE